MSCILQTAPANEPGFLFLDKKRADGKHYFVYMMAGANKFLRIYYARVKEHLDQLENIAWADLSIHGQRNTDAVVASFVMLIFILSKIIYFSPWLLAGLLINFFLGLL